MQALLFTADEPLYLPGYLEPILRAHGDAIAEVIIAQPPDPRHRQLRAQLDMFGPVDFVRIGRRFAAGKLLAQLPATWQRQLAGRYGSVASLASALDIPYRRVPDVTAGSFVEDVRRQDPELLLSIVCGQRLGPALLQVPDWAINVHGSLLPRYRGRATAFWPLYYGDERSGVTAHLMTEAYDAGPIVAQRSFEIPPGATMHDVYRLLAQTGAALTIELLDEFPDPSFDPRPNRTTEADYHTLPTPAERRAFKRRGNAFL